MTIITIITPSYNEKAMLKRCMASVRDQAGDDLTIVHHIQDGMSTDGTPEWLAEVEQSLITEVGYYFSYTSEKDDGMYDALNRGIERIFDFCTYKHIETSAVAWLNCDEQYLPGTLKNIADKMKAHPSADLLYGNTLHIDPNGRLLTYRKNPPLRKFYVKADHLYIQSASIFFKSSIFEEGERFDTSLKAISDCLFIINLLEKKKVARHINDYLSIFTMTGDNLSIEDVGLKELKYWHDAASAFIKLFRPIINGFRYFEKWLAGGYSEKFPLTYSIYLNDNEKRECIVTNTGSWKFTWGR